MPIAGGRCISTPDDICAANTLLILVDPTHGPLETVGSSPREALVKNLCGLVDAAAIMRIPVVLATAPLSPPASRLPPELASRLSNALQAEHSTNNCWQTESFRRLVEKTGRKVLALAGIATDVGVGLTALSAQAAGYEVYVIFNACGTLDAGSEQAALLRLATAGVSVCSWVAFCGEIQQDYARAPEGPELRRLIGRSTGLGGPFSNEIPRSATLNPAGPHPTPEK